MRQREGVDRLQRRVSDELAGLMPMLAVFLIAASLLAALGCEEGGGAAEDMSEKDGCGCRSSGPSPLGTLALLLLGVSRRRRGSPARAK